MTTGNSTRCQTALRSRLVRARSGLSRLGMLIFCLSCGLSKYGNALAEEPVTLIEIQAVAEEKAAEPAVVADGAVFVVEGNLELQVDNVQAFALGVQAPNDPEKQFAEMWRGALNAELNFVRQICGDIPLEQRKQIKKDGEQALSEVAKFLAQEQQQAQQPNALARWMAGMNLRPKRVVPAVKIRDALEKSVTKTVEPAIAERYADELSKRIARRKRAAILGVVARLDKILFLSAQQRREIADSLAGSWQPEWENWVNANAYQYPYIPEFSAQHVTSLNADQKSVWDSLQKINFEFTNFNGRAQLDAEWWGGPPPMGNTFWKMLRDSFK